MTKKESLDQKNSFGTTIFANATGVGGAISIIRVSGEDLSKLSLIIPSFNKLKHRFATVADIINPNNGGKRLDSALVTVFLAPNSFTGENVAEISCHGGHYINKIILGLLSEVCGFKMAQAGEFCKRAFLNGKMDLLQAEGINAMIKAQTKIEHQIASEMMYGTNSAMYKNWRKQILDILSRLEASIDFEDEGVERVEQEWIETEVSALIKEIEKHVSGSKRCRKVSSGISIGIFGRPNAGKSSLLNEIAGQEIAIVTSTPGTTRDIVSAKMEINGAAVSIFDTAGIRETNDEIEKEGVKRALSKKMVVDISIIVIDLSSNLQEEVEYIKQSIGVSKGDLEIIVFNKVDIPLTKDGGGENSLLIEKMGKGTPQSLNQCCQRHGKKSGELLKIVEQKAKEALTEKGIKADFLVVSTKTGHGLKSLIGLIEGKIKESFTNGIDSAVLAEHNLAMLQNCLNMLKTLTLSQSVEIIASKLQNVANMLSCVVGGVTAEDVLDEIFSTFCIGK